MIYVLKEMTKNDVEQVLENCGEREKNRLIRNGRFERPKRHGWAVNESIDSYLFRTDRKGDPKEDIREDYYFFFDSKNYYIITNGQWPLRAKYNKSEVEESQASNFERHLHSAFETHGLYGFIDKESLVLDISISGE